MQSEERRLKKLFSALRASVLIRCLCPLGCVTLSHEAGPGTPVAHLISTALQTCYNNERAGPRTAHSMRWNRTRWTHHHQWTL